jgi:hypothetical protein
VASADQSAGYRMLLLSLLTLNKWEMVAGELGAMKKPVEVHAAGFQPLSRQLVLLSAHAKNGIAINHARIQGTVG